MPFGAEVPLVRSTITVIVLAVACLGGDVAAPTTCIEDPLVGLTVAIVVLLVTGFFGWAHSVFTWEPGIVSAELKTRAAGTHVASTGLLLAVVTDLFDTALGTGTNLTPVAKGTLV